MFVDKQNEFSDSQAVTATAISTNVIDTLPMTGNPNLTQNLGGFQGAFLVVQIDVTFTGATSMAISLESDSTANLATSPTVHYNSGAIVEASLVAGANGGNFIIIPLPVGAYERYLGLRYTVVGTHGAGAISAFLVRDIQNWRTYGTASASNL
jgi:hypothetical protein